MLPTTGCAALLVLLLATVNAWACGQGSGSSSITNLPTLGGSGFYAYAMNPAGQVTGVAYTTGDLAAHAFLYSGGALTDLGTLGGSFGEGFAINALGQVAGEATVTGDVQLHAMLFNGTNMVDLQTLGGSYSSASAINNAGQVAGRSLITGDADMDLFLYANGSMLDLGNLGGGSPSVAGLNQLGSVAGDSYTADVEYHALLYANGAMLDLGTLGGLYSSAYALNDANTVVGESTLTNGQTHAFVYAAGVMTDLGTLGGTSSSARDVNNAGQIIGLASTANDLETHGFIYANGAMTDLGTLGGTYVQPIALNNLGQVVGTAAATDGSYHAFLWQNGTLVDLNSLLPQGSGWVLSSGQLINDSGRIVGYGLLSGASQWFVLDLASSNQPPVAVAGPDQTVDCQSPAVLNGTGSSDPDGDALAYEWSLGGSVLGTTSTLTVSLPLGTNVVTLKVTDPCGASAQTNVVVRVIDTTSPVVVSVLAPAPASADANCQAVVPDVVSQTVATDNCTPVNALVITQAPLAGTVVGLGPHTIVVTVTDASGNSTSTNVVFTVADTTPPTITTLTVSPSVISPPNHQMVPVTVSVAASDSCDPAPVSRIISITSNDPQPGDNQITGDLTASVLAAKTSSGDAKVYTLTVQCTDASGNNSSGTVTVTVQKNGRNPK